jgi:hypothetical protein
MKEKFILVALVGVLLLTACQPSNSNSAAAEVPSSAPAAAQPDATNSVEEAATPMVQTDVPAEPQGSLPPVKVGAPSPDGQKMALLSQSDLSKRLNVSVDAIVIKMVQPVVWPDASLGCPQPDTVYVQMLTNGFIVALEADGQKYLYNTDESETVVYCKESELPMFPVTPGEIDDGQPWVPVK